MIKRCYKDKNIDKKQIVNKSQASIRVKTNNNSAFLIISRVQVYIYIYTLEKISSNVESCQVIGCVHVFLVHIIMGQFFLSY